LETATPASSLDDWTSRAFRYGPEPADWHFERISDNYASEFWRLVEQEEVLMPGGWDDEWEVDCCFSALFSSQNSTKTY